MIATNRCTPGTFRSVLAIGMAGLLAMAALPEAARGACYGDCNADASVTVNELITLINIALGTAPVTACPGSATDGQGHSPEIPDIIDAVDNALLGCPSGAGVCGDGVTGGLEECDDGGLCVGGSNAGAPCTDESQCSGNGVCNDGTLIGYPCATDNDCPDGHCTRCQTFGGDGCAANCTLEKDLDLPLISGVANDASVDLLPGTSGAVIHGDILTVPLPLSGSEKVTVGKAGADGRAPFVIKAANFVFPKIEVSALGEACVRAVPPQTCGGTVFEADGSDSPPCGLGVIEVECPTDRPCAPVFGPGNSGAGTLGCTGLTGVDVSVSQDAGGNGGQAGPVLRTLHDSGPPGSARMLSSVSITSHVGIDPTFCVEGQPLVPFGQVSTVLLTTGTSCCAIQNFNGQDGTSLGPFCVSGAPLNCSALDGDPLTGGIAGAVPLLAQPTVQDICTTIQLFAKPRTSPLAAAMVR